MGSGYASYDDLEFERCKKFFEVPVVKATKESLKGLGRVVHDFSKEDVIIEQWPQPGKRKVMPGTGVGGGDTMGIFRFWWEKEFLRAQNEAVGGDYIVGKRIDDYVYTRELNYHPDGGQVVYPTGAESPFILLLGNPVDDIKLEDITAFLCDGSFGVQILPNVWHQPVFPKLGGVFLNKQGAVHACVGFDSVKELGVWLRFKL